MNDNDKAGRYLIKREPQGFLRWLLADANLTFHAWIDARRVVLPNQNDLTNDLVAAVSSGGALGASAWSWRPSAREEEMVLSRT